MGESKPKQSSVSGAIVNLINAVLGAGIVSLPFAWAKAGFILGWIMFIWTAVFTCYTLELLIHLADPLCRRGEISIVSYEVLAGRILGTWGKVMVIISQFLFAFGIGVGYVVIIHDELPEALTQIFQVNWFDDNQLKTVLIAAFGVLLPLSLMKDMSALAKASLFCFFSAFFLICVMGYEVVEDRDFICNDNHSEDSEYNSGSGPVCDQQWDSFGKLSVFSVYGIFVFTKACHHTEFQIYRSLGEDATPQRWEFICRVAIVLCSLITSTCAMLVYSIFGVQVESDFFKSFSSHNTAVAIGRLMFATLIMSSFPMQMFVSRETLQILINMYYTRNVSDEEAEYINTIRDTEEQVEEGDFNQVNRRATEENTRVSGRHSRTNSSIERRSRGPDDNMSAAGGNVRGETSNMMHYGTSIFLFAVTLGLGISTDNLGQVLGLVGGVAGSMIAFFLPGMIGYYSEEATGIKPILGKKLAGFTAVFGLVTVFVTSVFTFVSI